MKVSTVEQMRNLDKRASEEYGIAENLLMENAALASYEVLRTVLKPLENKRILLFCGTGNNGGDSLALGRKLHSMGAEIRVIILGDPGKYRGAAELNYSIIKKIPCNIISAPDDSAFEEADIQILLNNCDAVVDGIFGTGLTRNPEGRYRKAIEMINNANRTVFSLDIPSGISGNYGTIMGTAVRADYTISFGLPKLGNILYPGYELCGRLYVTHISFPEKLSDNPEIKCALNMPAPLPKRSRTGHKGTFGDALFISGAASYYGAPYFSALAFLKAGGGYSRLACPGSMVPGIGGKAGELVFIPQKETSEGSIAFKNVEELLNTCSITDIAVIGPGLSRNRETGRLVCGFAEKADLPLLIDGDGLFAVSEDPSALSVLKKRKSPTILTPHPGEFSKLTGRTKEEIADDPCSILRDFAENTDSITLLKGAHTLIAFPDGSLYINMSGNSGMGTAGSGDVLTGVIAAVFGLGTEIEDAVKTGVFLHGFAGDIAAENRGEDGITAEDILNALPEALKRYREEYDAVTGEWYHSVVLI